VLSEVLQVSPGMESTLGADRGVVGPWPGVHDGVVGQGEQPGTGSTVDDRCADRLVRQSLKRSAGRARAAVEQRVAGEDAAQVGA
jgi:hypothetical protein